MMNPVLVEVANIQIHWYSILILVGAFLGYKAAMSEARRFDINTNFISNLFFWTFIFSIIGARLYYVAFKWDYYKENMSEILQMWNGGLAIHGGILAGLIFVFLYTKKYGVKTSRITDISVVALALAQIVGRWGNFFNSEAYGPETTRSFLENLHLPNFIVDGMNIYGTYYQPTFLYESLWMLAGLIVLLIFRRMKYTKIGQTTAVYLIWYGIGRFGIESLRSDSLMLGDFKMAQIVSGLMIIIGILVFVLKGRGSKFDNLYGEKDGKEIKF